MRLHFFNSAVKANSKLDYWRMHYRRGLQTDYNTKNLYQAEKPSLSEPRNHQTLTWTNLTDDEPVPCKRDNWDQSILVLQKLWLETMTMKVSMPKSQKTLLIAVNFITSENENCVFLPHIFIPMRRDLPQITFQRSMTHTACVACGPKTTDFSRFPEKRHSTKVLEHLWQGSLPSWMLNTIEKIPSGSVW